jgi:HD-GYP domain-containing protein (c-di-GMP phosphodiesterase class II)
LTDENASVLWTVTHHAQSSTEALVAVSDAGLLGEAISAGTPAVVSEDGTARAMPLVVRNSVVGSLGIAGCDVAPGDLERLEDMAAMAALGLEHAAEHRRGLRSVTEMATVLSSLIESRDTYTESHCVALAEMSVAIGIRMGLTSEQLTVLNLAGHLHDIGKVSIPDEVLLKRGPLTESEYSVMKSHAAIGERVLSRITSFAQVAPVVGQHHERFDGTGYPRGLSRDDILLEARVLAVVDAFDAMTTSRPYRPALPAEVAVQEIIDGAGSQFDPEVAGMFLRYLEGEEAQWTPNTSN